MKNLWALIFNHQHYWGVPHPREGDGKIQQVCYECGQKRLLAVELRAGVEVKP